MNLSKKADDIIFYCIHHHEKSLEDSNMQLRFTTARTPTVANTENFVVCDCVLRDWCQASRLL